jgi:hypothetical protein
MKRFRILILTILLVSAKWSFAAVGDFSAVIDSLVISSSNSTRTCIAQVDTNHVFLVSYITTDTYGHLASISCSATGDIGSDTISTYAWSGSLEVSKQSMIYDNGYAIIAYLSWEDTLKVYAIPVSSSGTITQSKSGLIISNSVGYNSEVSIMKWSSTVYVLSYGTSNGLVMKSLSISGGAMSVLSTSTFPSSENFKNDFPGVCRVGQTNYGIIRAAENTGTATKLTYSFTCDPTTGVFVGPIDSVQFGGGEGGRAFVDCVNTYSSPLFITSCPDNNGYQDISTISIDSTDGNLSDEIDGWGSSDSPNCDNGWTPTPLKLGNGVFLFNGGYKYFGIVLVDTATALMGPNNWNYAHTFPPFSNNTYSSMCRCGKSGKTYCVLSVGGVGSDWGPLTAFTFSVEGGYEGGGESIDSGWPHIISGLSDFSYIAGIVKEKVNSIAGLE